jgi:hypothetical protein
LLTRGDRGILSEYRFSSKRNDGSEAAAPKATIPNALTLAKIPPAKGHDLLGETTGNKAPDGLDLATVHDSRTRVNAQRSRPNSIVQLWRDLVIVTVL